MRKYDTVDKICHNGLANKAQGDAMAASVKILVHKFKYIEKEDILILGLVDKVLDSAGLGFVFLGPKIFKEAKQMANKDDGDKDAIYLHKNLEVLVRRQCMAPRVTRFIERAVGREHDRIIKTVKMCLDGEYPMLFW